MSNKYTVVQHSGHDKPGFYKGLEEAALKSDAEAELVKAVGGRVFDSYVEASEWAEAEQYPPDVKGLYPKAPGLFARLLKVGGRRVYIPRTQSEGR